MNGEAEGKAYRIYGSGVCGGRSVARLIKRFRKTREPS
jgi:hypothetical protein